MIIKMNSIPRFKRGLICVLEGGTNITLGSTPTRSKHMFGIWVASLNDEQRSIYT